MDNIIANPNPPEKFILSYENLFECGEISWTSVSNVPKENETFKQYIKGERDFWADMGTARRRRNKTVGKQKELPDVGKMLPRKTGGVSDALTQELRRLKSEKFDQTTNCFFR